MIALAKRLQSASLHYIPSHKIHGLLLQSMCFTPGRVADCIGQETTVNVSIPLKYAIHARGSAAAFCSRQVYGEQIRSSGHLALHTRAIGAV